MRTTNFDALAAAAPLDRQASIVRDGSGDHWEAKTPPGIEHFKAPPPQEDRKPRDKADLTGKIVGRMTVVRYHRTSGAGRGIWLLRCQCGDYETRRGEKIRGNPWPDYCCYACIGLKRVQVLGGSSSTTKTRAAAAENLDGLARKVG